MNKERILFLITTVVVVVVLSILLFMLEGFLETNEQFKEELGKQYEGFCEEFNMTLEVSDNWGIYCRDNIEGKVVFREIKIINGTRGFIE